MRNYIPTIQKAKDFIREHNGDVTPDNVASFCAYSTRQLNRIFEIVTGATMGEFLRWTRLSKALYEIKYTDEPILDIALKYKYESQEAFTRIFKRTFSLTPGEYRKPDREINIKSNYHLQKIIEEVSHEAANKGLYKAQAVDSWQVVKPSRLWINFDSNKNNRTPHEFWNNCNMVTKSDFDKLIPSDYIIDYDAAYLTMIKTEDYLKRASWGLAIDGSYDIGDLDASICPAFRIIENIETFDINDLKPHDMFKIPESRYVVFFASKQTIENHGITTKNVWDAANNYNYAEHGFETNYENAPIYEIPDDLGETVWFPVREINNRGN
jgi:AraC-like DNA-binding protein